MPAWWSMWCRDCGEPYIAPAYGTHRGPRRTGTHGTCNDCLEARREDATLSA